MSSYVIGDIHGCYDEFMQMLDKIVLSDGDRLLLVGDYIDRGPDSLKMLRWLENCPANVTPVRGNHDDEFATYVAALHQVDEKWELGTQPDSHSDAAALYDTAKYLFKSSGLNAAVFFDLYGTLGRLLQTPDITMRNLDRWAEIIRGMPYFVELSVNGRRCVVVHAGYRDGGFASEEDAADYYLYAREESLTGGIRHGVVIAGHTPTVLEDEFAHHGGKAFRFYDAQKDCVFYDLDCGCVFRKKYPDARLACLRVEDEKLFYV